MAEKKIRIDVRDEDVCLMEVGGDVTLETSPELRQHLLAQIREHPERPVVLALPDVRYLDSSGVATIIEGLKASRDGGARLLLAALSPSVRGVLELTNVLELFDVCTTVEAAMVAARGPADTAR